MVPLFCFLILLAGKSLASFSSNQYVEQVIQETMRRMHDLNPRYLPSYIFEYKDKTIFGEVEVDVEYSSGRLTGLTSLRRYFECEDPIKTSENVTINCCLTFEPLVATYEGKFKYGILPKVNISAKGVMPSILVDVEFSRSLHPEPYDYSSSRVTALKVRTTSTVITEFSRLGPLNGRMKNLENNYRDWVNSEIMEVIENTFRYRLNEAAYRVYIPLN